MANLESDNQPKPVALTSLRRELRTELRNLLTAHTQEHKGESHGARAIDEKSEGTVVDVRTRR